MFGETPSRAAPRPPDLRWLVLGLLLFGVGVRIWVLLSPLGALDSDEGTVGLMARRMPSDLPAFFWGQSYGGTQEAILASVLFWVLGPTVHALKLVPVLLSGASSWLVWRVGRRSVGEPAAALGAALFWATPAAFVWWSTKERGHYWATLVLGLAVLLFLLRLEGSGDDGWRRGVPRWVPDVAALGFVAGLGWWASAHIVFFVVPGCLWLVWRDRRYLARLWLAAPTAALGALPWIAGVANRGVTGFEVRPQPQTNSYAHHLEGFFTEGLPRALGLLPPFAEFWIPAVVGPVLYASALGAFLWALWRRPPGTTLLLLVAASYPFLYSVSPMVWWLEDARYLLFLGPALSLLLARAATASPGRTHAPLGLSVVAAALTVAGLVVPLAAGIAPTAPDVTVPDDVAPLVSTLEDVDRTAVFANYWVANRLAFESRERIAATPPGGVRLNEDAERIVRAAPRPAYVFVRGSKTSVRFEIALARAGVLHRRVETPDRGFVVYLPERRVLPEDLPGVWAGQGA